MELIFVRCSQDLGPPGEISAVAARGSGATLHASVPQDVQGTHSLKLSLPVGVPGCVVGFRVGQLHFQRLHVLHGFGHGPQSVLGTPMMWVRCMIHGNGASSRSRMRGAFFALCTLGAPCLAGSDRGDAATGPAPWSLSRTKERSSKLRSLREARFCRAGFLAIRL